jgi:hypothetical protein
MPSYTIHNRSHHSRRIWFKFAAYGVCIWGVIVSMTVLSGLSALRAVAPGNGVTIGLGPLPFLHVEKTLAPGGGYALTCGLRPGLLVVLALCMVLQFVLFWFGCRRPIHDTQGVLKQ